MKLERTLIELTTLVDYGTEYLLNRSKTWTDVVNTIEDEHPLDVLPYMNQSDILDYVKDNYNAEDVYGDVEIDEIARNMVDCMSLGEIMDIQGLTENDVLSTLKDGEIIDYVRDHFYPLDVFDDEPCLVGMCDKTILDYVKMNFDVKKVFDLVWEMADEDDWRDFVTNNFVPTDFIEWRVD